MSPDPELDDKPYGWSCVTPEVDLTFQEKEGGPEDESAGGVPESAASAPKAPKNDKKWRNGPDRLWFVNWDKAVAEAQKTKKRIFVLNTGSDWCGWCKKLKADVLSTGKFKGFARKNLVLFYLDSPRQKPLPEEQQNYNKALASYLSFGGGVPCVKIVESDGKTVKATISGYKPQKEYMEALNAAVKD